VSCIELSSGNMDDFWDRCFPSPSAKSAKLQKWYEMLADKYANVAFTFMNYGFVENNPDATPVPLDPAEEEYRHPIQLYHHVVSPVDLRGKKVLEVGSGRGGGASWVMRNLGPKTLTGVDYSLKAVRLCRKLHSIAGLTFLVAAAENLPFESESFDVVINVESCHGYASQPRFLSEVLRVLRPEGHLLLADFHSPVGMNEFRRLLTGSGFTMADDRNITKNVFLSMEIAHPKMVALIKEHVPGEQQIDFVSFAGLEGSWIYEGLKRGFAEYASFVLQKPVS